MYLHLRNLKSFQILLLANANLMKTSRKRVITTDLVFVELTVFILLLTLTLKCDDHKTHENIHHEECDNDDEHKVEYSHKWAVVVYRPFVAVV